MKLIIEINLQSAYFDSSIGYRLGLLLKRVVASVAMCSNRSSVMEHAPAELRDTYGVKVGCVKIETRQGS